MYHNGFFFKIAYVDFFFLFNYSFSLAFIGETDEFF